MDRPEAETLIMQGLKGESEFARLLRSLVETVTAQMQKTPGSFTESDIHREVSFVLDANLPAARAIFDQDQPDIVHTIMLAVGEHARLFRLKQQCFEDQVMLPAKLYQVMAVLLIIAERLLIKRRLPFLSDQLGLLIAWGFFQEEVPIQDYPIDHILKHVDHFLADHEAVSPLFEILEQLIQDADLSAKRKKLYSNKIGILPMNSGEAWSDMALQEIAEMSEKDRTQWKKLLNHCVDCSGAKPTAKWMKEADALKAEIDSSHFIEHIARWLDQIDRPRTVTIETWEAWEPNPNLLIDEANVNVLKGMVWFLRESDNALIARCVTKVAMSAYKKIPGVGPRAVKLGNACLYTLGTLPGTLGVAQLALLKVRIKQANVQKGIAKALAAAANIAGLSAQELEEIGVPSYGLTEVGRLEAFFGEHKAILSMPGKKTEILWQQQNKKVQKSVPKSVKEHFADELKALKLAAKDIEKMLPAQSARIEHTYLSQQKWPLHIWRERYLDHPLVGMLARKLIWLCTRDQNQISVLWSDKEGGLVDHRGKSVSWLSDQVQVKLWHPLDELANRQRILDWRNYLLDQEIRQPFKQAYREIYLLTDAERNTGTYSNRFAAHIIKQHQFGALCGARNWKNQLRLMVDDTFPPAHIVLPNWGLRAEFWVEAIGDRYGTDTTETGTFLYLSTDQVRFYRQDAGMNYAHATGGGYEADGSDIEENHPLPLADVPPLVLSEVLRDVDLFVGVASVGNDPTWSDGGPEGRFRNYWESYSFGHLNATALTRKAVLEKLIPRLKIASRCHFTERFLVVKGDVRTYRIHLGSGNIQMEPDNEYLCIVPNQSLSRKTDGLFLPFEGDATLSIILSKAMMLADDTKIKDKTILSQIH